MLPLPPSLRVLRMAHYYGNSLFIFQQTIAQFVLLCNIVFASINSYAVYRQHFAERKAYHGQAWPELSRTARVSVFGPWANKLCFFSYPLLIMAVVFCVDPGSIHSEFLFSCFQQCVCVSLFVFYLSTHTAMYVLLLNRPLFHAF